MAMKVVTPMMKVIPAQIRVKFLTCRRKRVRGDDDIGLPLSKSV
jgi:hypothetical protein